MNTDTTISTSATMFICAVNTTDSPPLETNPNVNVATISYFLNILFHHHHSHQHPNNQQLKSKNQLL